MPDGTFDTIPEEHIASPLLVEHMVKENMQDIKSLKRRMYDVETKTTNQEMMIKLANQTMTQVIQSVESLKTDLKDDRKDNKAIQEENHKHQLETLKQYKNSVWTVGITIVGSGAVALFVFMLNN